MPDRPGRTAIRFADVSKVYRLYPNPRSMMMDLLGGYKYKFWRKPPVFPEFAALTGVNLEIQRGERIGVVGRNGAGKTTLLKLMTENFEPTSGTVTIDGRIQSLMDTGLGFHPEFTGYENIRASLIYNALEPADMQAAIDDIVDFVELGDFLQQPIKTYSLGMLSRLGFATSTAIKPDILIVDEVLSAGDAYFSAKSAERMKRLASDGTTLVLVSHSTDQILQFCNEAVWMDKGRVVQRGEALEVMKAYEAYIRELENERLQERNRQGHGSPEGALPVEMQSQPTSVAHVAPVGARTISRWQGGLDGLRINRVRLFDADGAERAVFQAGESMTFEIELRAERAGSYPCQYHVYVYTLDGIRVTLHVSEADEFDLAADETRRARLTYDRILLNQGDYVFTVALYETFDFGDPGAAIKYDLLDRSFEFKVYSAQATNQTIFRHPARWTVCDGPELTDIPQ